MTENQPDFSGSYPRKVDSKGRLTLPSTWWRQISYDRLVAIGPIFEPRPKDLTAPKDLLLFFTVAGFLGYKRQQFELMQQIGLPELAAERLIFGNSLTLEIKSNGRLQMPTRRHGLRLALIQPGDDIILHGQGDRFKAVTDQSALAGSAAAALTAR